MSCHLSSLPWALHFPEGLERNTKCKRLDFSTNTQHVFSSAGCSTGVDVGVSCAVPGKSTNYDLFFGNFSFG